MVRTFSFGLYNVFFFTLQDENIGTYININMHVSYAVAHTELMSYFSLLQQLVNFCLS